MNGSDKESFMDMQSWVQLWNLFHIQISTKKGEGFNGWENEFRQMKIRIILKYVHS